MPTGVERLRVVLDTNVLVSGFTYTGTPNRILTLLLQGEADWYVSPFILSELRHVLSEKFHWEEGRVRRVLALIGEVATEMDPPRSVQVVRAKDDDNRILDCAAHAKAHYLVSRDRRHLLSLGEFRGVSVVTPAEFLTLLLRNQGTA